MARPQGEIPRRVLWQKCRRGEVQRAAAAGGLALLPIGSVEQHGPHLPLDTDSFSAFTIAVRAAEQVAEFPVLVLPPVWWGLSPYWMVFPGTLTLRAETLTEIIVDIAASVARHGFRHMVIVNGHGGNHGLMQAAAVKASSEEFRVAALSYWTLVADEMRALSTRDGGGIGHAGEMETSIQLHLQPECVDMTEVKPEHCVDLEAYERAFARGVYLPPNPRDESPHGVYGMSHAADEEKGRRVVAAAAGELAAFVRTFRR